MPLNDSQALTFNFDLAMTRLTKTSLIGTGTCKTSSIQTGAGSIRTKSKMKTALLQAAPRASQASSIASKILSMVPTKASLPCVMTHARLDKATSVVQDSKAMIPSISFTLRI